ncbi:TonB-dependent siderophore receptor [Halomonas sp. THAF12]|uniref:TonB-dependent siderophore receptor n=1 Tax=Halomonas sp. B23F22_10 TaxID=3459515 RepID=UPI00373EC0EE
MHHPAFRRRWLAYAIANACGTLLVTAPALAQDAASANRPDDAGTLPTVTVTEEMIRDAATENSGSYTSDRATIGMSERSLKETPQSVSVVTRERLDDQNLTTLADALRNTTGLTVRQFGPSQYEIKARGYVSDFFLVDGSPVQDVGSSWESSGMFDTALFDRIEVLRGPAGIQHGTGEPSGTINMARKRALAESQASVALSAGTEDAYRGVVDVTGALDQEGRVRGRLVGVYDDRDSFIDHVYSENQVGYGTLEFDLTPATTLSIGATVQDEEYRPHSGLPAYSDGSLVNADRSTYLGSRWDRQTGDAQRYFAELEHRLDNGGSITLKANRVERDTRLKKSSEGVLAADPTTGDFATRQIAWDLDKQDDYLEAQLQSPFGLFGRTHEAVLGTSYQDSTIDQQYAFGDPLYLPNNVFEPNHDSPEPDFPTWNPLQASTEQTATYGQARFNFTDALTLALGGRVTWWETTNNDTEDSGTEFTPYVGLIYRLTPDLNLYTSYTGIFEPQTATRSNGDTLEPREGDQVELGIKGSHHEGRLNWHAAVFHIEDNNRAFQDPDNPAFSIPVGEVESQGFEAEVSGQLTPRWDVTAGYAYTSTDYVRDDSNEGLTFSPDTPKHNVNLWTRYRFSDDPTHGWRIGAGLNTLSGTYAESGGQTIEQGGYTTVSALVGYRVNEHLDIALNGNNLTDKEYYTTVRGLTKHNYYGAPRNAMLTMKYAF